MMMASQLASSKLLTNNKRVDVQSAAAVTHTLHIYSNTPQTTTVIHGTAMGIFSRSRRKSSYVSEAADTSAEDTAWGLAHTAESSLQPRWSRESFPARDGEQQRSVLVPELSMR